MTDKAYPELPELPKLDPKLSIPYESIRYIAGYAETTVHRFMTEYARQAVEADRASRTAAGSGISDANELLAEAQSEGFGSVAEYVAALKQSKATYFAERNSARNAYHRHRDESEALGKLINIVLGLVGAEPGANVVHAVSSALSKRTAAILAMAPATTQAQEAVSVATAALRRIANPSPQDWPVCIAADALRALGVQPEHEPSPHVANTLDCGHEAGSNEAFERWYAQYHEDACVMYGGLSGNPKDVAHDAWDSALAYPTAPPTAPVEAVTAQGDEVIPPRPAGYNDASTDPGSPLQRWGKPRHEGAKLLLQPLDDGYWTPWHIANEMLRSAQSGDEAQVLADAIEALPRYSFGYKSDEWGMGNYLAGIASDTGAYILREDALRAAREAMGGAKS